VPLWWAFFICALSSGQITGLSRVACVQAVEGGLDGASGVVVGAAVGNAALRVGAPGWAVRNAADEGRRSARDALARFGAYAPQPNSDPLDRRYWC
jgi:hypothetical protein